MKIIRKLETIILILLGYTRFTWNFIILYKLRYKFNAVYFGIRKNKSTLENLYNFRRNIHRLEKGLSYNLVKSTFAEDYIADTVLYLENGKKQESFDKETVDWGKSVLNLYFSKVEHTKKINQSYTRFKNLLRSEIQEGLVPYQVTNRPLLKVSYEDLLNLAIRRRSVRYYLDKKVEPEIIKKAYEIAKYSPSACNRQSFDFLFYNKKEIVEKLSSIPGGVSGYTLPSVIVVIGNYSGYFDERDINAPIIDSSLSIMSFLFALETLGLSSVCINWPNLPDREKKIRKILALNKYDSVVMMIGVGYPDDKGKIPYSAKRNTEVAVQVNKKIKYT